MKKQILYFITVIFLTVTSGVLGQNLQQGIMLFKNNSYEKAEDVFKKVMHRDNSALAAYYLGNIELERENDSLAIVYFNKAVTIDKKNPYGYVGLGKVLLNYSKPDSAHSEFDRAYNLSKAKDADLLCEISEHYILTRADSGKAKSYLEKAMAANPLSARVQLLLGDWFLLYRNDGSNAVRHYNKAGELSPSSPEVNIRLGDLYARTANLELSKQYFADGIKADSTCSIAYLKMGDVLYKMKKYKEARTFYEKYFSLSEASPTTMLKYAYSLFVAKDYADAIEILNGLKQSGKMNLSYQRLSGYVFYEMAEYDSCVKALRNIIRYYPAGKITVMDYEYLGKALQNLDEDSLAIINYKKALIMDSSKIYLQRSIADIYFSGKEYKHAIEAYTNLINASENKNVANYYLLGKAYYYINNYTIADSIFSIVSDLSPSYAFVYLYRARCNNQDPDSSHNASKEYYKKYLSLSDSADESTFSYYKEACFNLAYYAIIEGDVDTARQYYKSVLLREPENKDALKYLKELKKHVAR